MDLTSLCCTRSYYFSLLALARMRASLWGSLPLPHSSLYYVGGRAWPKVRRRLFCMVLGKHSPCSSYSPIACSIWYPTCGRMDCTCLLLNSGLQLFPVTYLTCLRCGRGNSHAKLCEERAFTTGSLFVIRCWLNCLFFAESS